MVVAARPEASKEQVTDLLTYSRFEDYLLSQLPSNFIGVCNHHLKCPLAWYLESKIFGYRFCELSQTTMFSDYDTCGLRGQWEIETPAWAREFIRCIDDLGNTTVIVTAEKALEVLYSIPICP